MMATCKDRWKPPDRPSTRPKSDDAPTENTTRRHHKPTTTPPSLDPSLSSSSGPQDIPQRLPSVNQLDHPKSLSVLQRISINLLPMISISHLLMRQTCRKRSRLPNISLSSLRRPQRRSTDRRSLPSLRLRHRRSLRRNDSPSSLARIWRMATLSDHSSSRRICVKSSSTSRPTTLVGVSKCVVFSAERPLIMPSLSVVY